MMDSRSPASEDDFRSQMEERLAQLERKLKKKKKKRKHSSSHRRSVSPPRSRRRFSTSPVSTDGRHVDFGAERRQRSSSPGSSQAGDVSPRQPETLPDIINQAWKIVSARSSVTMFQRDPSKPSLDTPVGGFFSRPPLRRPDSVPFQSALKSVDSFLLHPKSLVDGLVPLTSIRDSLRKYVPSSQRFVFGAPASSTKPELSSSSNTMSLSLKKWTHLEKTADVMINISQFLGHISDVLFQLAGTSPLSADDQHDFQVLSSALSALARDSSTVAATQAVNFRLLRRDHVLSSSALPADTVDACRHSAVLASSVFGPEADHAVSEHRSSLATALKETRPLLRSQPAPRVSRGRGRRRSPARSVRRRGGSSSSSSFRRRPSSSAGPSSTVTSASLAQSKSGQGQRS